MADPSENLTFNGAKIMWRNFEGREGQYNRAGDRNFCVFLEEDDADRMRAEGWNVKTLRSKDDPADVQNYIQVSVGFKGRPPKIALITSQGRTDLDEDLVEMLDFLDVKNVDLIIRPYDWAVSGNTGRKAYLKTLFFTVDEDELEMRYRDVPVVGAPPRQLELEAAPDFIDAEEVE